MKKILKLGLTALSCACVIGLAACTEKDNPLDHVVDYSEFPTIDMEALELGQKVLSSISIDTTNGKTKYYVGEKFTTEGLVVKANYVQLVDGSNQGSSSEINSYFYDLNDVDMNKEGTYTVEFKYREGDKVMTAPLTITVSHSYLADLGIEYLAGLEPVETVIEIAKGSTFDAKKVATFKKKYMQGTDKGVVETKVEDMTAADVESLKVESSVNTAKAGKYTVYYSYDASVTLEDKTVYNYTLKSFVVIIVK